jgi:hypothetical protein
MPLARRRLLSVRESIDSAEITDYKTLLQED